MSLIQIQPNKTELNGQNDAGLKAKFEELKNKKVEKATTKVVNFIIQSGCGCGGNYTKYHAEVPIDTKINDGDYLDDFRGYMSNIGEGWV